MLSNICLPLIKPLWALSTLSSATLAIGTAIAELSNLLSQFESDKGRVEAGCRADSWPSRAEPFGKKAAVHSLNRPGS
eukprot:5230830-Pyramimonas_sp.AAC.1